MNRIITRANDSIIALDPLWQWGDFVQRANQIAQQFQQDNIQSVALWLEDAAHFACVLQACLIAKVRVLLPPNQLADNHQWALAHSDFYFDDRDFADYGCQQKVAENRPLFDLNDPTEIWLRTSGSSGESKVIVKQALQFWQEVATTTPYYDFPDQPQVQGSVSVQHMFGLTFRVFLGLYQGWIIGRKQLNYAEELIAASKDHPTVWISSPALLNNINFQHMDLVQCKVLGIFSAGGVLPDAIAEQVERTLAPVIEIYGSSETGSIAYRLDRQKWQIFPHSQIGLNDNDELWFESRWSGGKQQTADVVEIADDGFVLLGRSDRIIKLYEHRISLNRIEQNLLKHQWVTDCYIGQHPVHQRLVAWVALTADALVLEKKQQVAELKQHLRQYEERRALPRFWRFTDKLPRNSQFKLLRADFETLCNEIN